MKVKQMQQLFVKEIVTIVSGVYIGIITEVQMTAVPNSFVLWSQCNGSCAQW